VIRPQTPLSFRAFAIAHHKGDEPAEQPPEAIQHFLKDDGTEEGKRRPVNLPCFGELDALVRHKHSFLEMPLRPAVRRFDCRTVNFADAVMRIALGYSWEQVKGSPSTSGTSSGNVFI
jgi:hypothetical protein